MATATKEFIVTEGRTDYEYFVEEGNLSDLASAIKAKGHEVRIVDDEGRYGKMKPLTPAELISLLSSIYHLPTPLA